MNLRQVQGFPFCPWNRAFDPELERGDGLQIARDGAFEFQLIPFARTSKCSTFGDDRIAGNLRACGGIGDHPRRPECFLPKMYLFHRFKTAKLFAPVLGNECGQRQSRLP